MVKNKINPIVINKSYNKFDQERERNYEIKENFDKKNDEYEIFELYKKILIAEGKNPLLVYDSGDVKYWILNDKNYNVQYIKTLEKEDIERLFEIGIIPYKSISERIKTKFGEQEYVTWLVNEFDESKLEDPNESSFKFRAFVSLGVFASSIVLTTLSGFNVTGHFVSDLMFAPQNLGLFIILIASLSYLLISNLYFSRREKEKDKLTKVYS